MTDTLHDQPDLPPDFPEGWDRISTQRPAHEAEALLDVKDPAPTPETPLWVSDSPSETAYGKEYVERNRQAEEDVNPEDIRYKKLARALGGTAAEFLVTAEDVRQKPGDKDALEFHEFAKEGARRDVAEIQKQIRKEFPQDHTAILQEKGLPADGEISDEDIKNFYVSRMEQLDTNTTERQEQLEVMRQEFMTALTWAAKRGLPVDLDRARERVDSIQFELFDRLVRELPAGRRTGGYYDAETDTIGFDGLEELAFTEHNKKETRRIIFHELLHGISGMRVIKTPDGSVGRQREGLIGGQDGFAWLNEAVTERLAVILNGMHDMSWRQRRQLNFAKMDADQFFDATHKKISSMQEYASEQRGVRDILRAVPRKQKPIQTLLGAYFEDYEPQGHGKTAGRHPQRKKLFRMMHAVVDLPALNATYSEQGAEVFENDTTASIEHDFKHRNSLLSRKRAQSHSRNIQKRQREVRGNQKATRRNIEEWRGRHAA